MCPKLPHPSVPTGRPTSYNVWPALSAHRARATLHRLLGGVALFSALLAPALCRADTITLVDNTQIGGRVVHFYDGLLAIETSTGQKVELPREKVKSITFKLPAPRPEFSTPEKTFERWRGFMQKGDAQKAIECYALMFQGMMQQQMLQTPDAVKQAQKDLDGVKIELRGSTTQKQGELQTATLKVRRTKGENVQTDEVHFVLENGEWKMTP